MSTEQTNTASTVEVLQSIPDNADLVTVSEYARRKHAADLLIDPTSSPISKTTINKKIAQGYIQVIPVNGNKFIDWNIYKNLPFRRYGQMPIKREKTPTV
jgi:hypothetical protein